MDHDTFHTPNILRKKKPSMIPTVAAVSLGHPAPPSQHVTPPLPVPSNAFWQNS